ncbi:MAG: exopolysaccharide biosynthesis protein [Limisphaerales bacterium]
MRTEPLSAQLRRLAEDPEVRTLNGLVQRTEGRGIYLVMLLLSLPLAAPVTLPGISNAFGLVLLWLSARLALRLPAQLPRFLGERPLAPETMARVIRGSVKLLAWVERCVKPRRSAWMRLRGVRLAHALLIVLMAFLLTLPVPPPILFTNTLPAISIVLLASCMMERDGRMIFAGYFFSAGTCLYFAAIAGVIIRLVIKYEERFLVWLRGLL